MKSESRGSRSNRTPTRSWKSEWNGRGDGAAGSKRGDGAAGSKKGSRARSGPGGHLLKACLRLRGENFPWQRRQTALDVLPAGRQNSENQTQVVSCWIGAGTSDR